MKTSLHYPATSCLSMFLLALSWATPVRGDIKLPAIFGHNMVLQQGQEAPVWGWGAPGEKVTVAFAGRQASATADGQGLWLARLTVPPASSQPGDLVVEGKTRVVYTNVVAGEIWLCSGQSNMKHPLSATTNAAAVIAAANFPGLRLFQVDMWCAPKPLANLRGKWVVCNSNTVGGFSAVGYYFGRDLHLALKAPVGLIDSSAGGTAAEAWIRQSVLEADPVLKALVQPDPEYFKAVDLWAEYLKAKEEQRTPLPPQPKFPFRGWGNPVSSFYNAMIAPLTPFRIQGVVWYQGEARTGRFFQYERELTALIENWRADWGRADMPFLIVQLPRITGVWNWPITREVQARVAQALPRVGLAVTIDLADTDLHPRIKEPVGRRLALAAEAIAYGKPVPYIGPTFAALKIEGDKVRLTFLHTDGGLAAQDGELKGFVVAGTNQQFVAAQARIDGAAVLVSAPGIAQPAAVRYAYEDNPDCNLFNGAGLPAAPFRTDDWPLVPQKQ